MKKDQNSALSPALRVQLSDMGTRLRQLRIARRVMQSEAANRAGISRATASLIENGAASVALGQIVRYVDAIAPGKTLVDLFSAVDPTVLAMEAGNQRARARGLSDAELKKLEF